MWGFRISTGAITNNGLKVGSGYSGHSDGRGNPKLVAVQNIGPIPPGKYKIGPAYDDPHLGPCVMHLDPLPGTEVFGRSLFRIHGDSMTAPGNASHGCICTAPAVRKAINGTQDRILEVTE